MIMTAGVIGCKPPSPLLPSTAVRVAVRVGRFAQRLDAHRFAGLTAMLALQQERYRSGQRMCDDPNTAKPLKKH